jgi:glutathione peroxidase
MHFYDLEVLDEKQERCSLRKYEGQVVLIVNTATECEYTEQYDDLEDLYQEYKDRGFTILDFPCNQFGEQAPGTLEEILSFCADTYGVSFPQFDKIEVNGPNESPLYAYLKANQEKELSKRIDWNFTKFLLDTKGNVIRRFEPIVKPNEIKKYIESLL